MASNTTTASKGRKGNRLAAEKLPRRGSKSGSTSRPSTPTGLEGSSAHSPMPTKDKSDSESEAWECKICREIFEGIDDKLLECQRCRGHFCITCLKKPVAEYILLTESDLMWFCSGCRERVEKDIITDVKIEERCKKFLEGFEDRLCILENSMKNKCERNEVKSMIKDEAKKEFITEEKVKIIVQKELDSRAETAGYSDQGNTTNKEETLNDVITEINDRKLREKNLIVFGFKELVTSSKSTRDEYDEKAMQEIIKITDKEAGEEEIVKVQRLGKYKDKKIRPVMVTLGSEERKGRIFKGAHKLKETKYDNIRLSNDLTQTERDNETKLFNQAKELEKNCPNGHLYKVRGPPWARKVVCVKKT